MKDPEVDKYISKQKQSQKDICLKLREIIFDTFPKILEEMKWGVPAYGNGKCYIVALKDHVNIGFAIAGLSREEIAMLQGNGKIMRHIEIRSENEIDEDRIVKLLKMV